MTAAAKPKLKLTWRKEPNETGLAGVTQSPRGAELRLNGKEVGSVAAIRISFQVYKGWYWLAGNEPTEELPFTIPRRNTCGKPVDTMEEAKNRCEAFVRKHLGLPPKRPKEKPKLEGT